MKTFLCLLLSLSAIDKVESQDNRGKWYTGINIGYNYNTESEKEMYQKFNAVPCLAYRVFNRIDIGIGIGHEFTRVYNYKRNIFISANSFITKPFVRFYPVSTNSFDFFIQGNLIYQRVFNLYGTEIESDEGGFSSGVRGKSMLDMGYSSGITIYTGNNFGFEIIFFNYETGKNEFYEETRKLTLFKDVSVGFKYSF